MKTNVPYRTSVNCLSLIVIGVLLSFSIKAQTYTTIANGAWSSASTWQGGSIPDATNILATAVINIKHIITYSGNDIKNGGTLNIANPFGVSPRLIVAGGVNLQNDNGGKINIIDGEYRQYRFVGGGETGVTQNGKFKNNGGYVKINNSFVEVAMDWSNESSGTVSITNSSLVMGGNYNLKNSAVDSLQYTSVSIGLHGSGDYTADGLRSYFQSVRFQVASSNGKFYLKSGTANGDIDYITLKNHVTNTISNNDITVNNLVATSGLNLDAYCAGSAIQYIPNGKVSGTQTLNCSINYFPAGLFGSASTSSFNLSTNPLLVFGTNLQIDAIYKYEGVTPGVDAYVKVDSLVGGAAITKIDDNTGGLGYMEGFQPEIKDGPATGKSYAVFTIYFKITGTSVVHTMNTFSLTALDIDGTSSLKEFDQIGLGAGATADYMVTPTNISLTQVVPGTFLGINTSGTTNPGIDTLSMANMFTVTNTNVSSFTLKFGTSKTNTSQTSRQFGIYMKGFVYQDLVTLPVKFESFIATLNSNNNKVDLKWTSASEINVSHFEVEKSTDGKNFSKAGVVFAYGNSTGKDNYNFSDKVNANQSGVVYYRLRSVDIDGKSQLSGIRIIRIGKQDEMLKMVTYPNPVINELRVTLPSAWQGKAVIFEVFNQSGHRVKNINNGSSSQTETIMVNNLAKGLYLVKAICGSEVAVQKIIKN